MINVSAWALSIDLKLMRFSSALSIGEQGQLIWSCGRKIDPFQSNHLSGSPTCTR
jgi:hypothetical protein